MESDWKYIDISTISNMKLAMRATYTTALVRPVLGPEAREEATAVSTFYT